MDDLRVADLWIQVQQAESQVNIRWTGISEAREPGVHLLPYLDQLVARVQGMRIEIDFTGMEYMNSATVAPIVRFIRALDRVCPQVVVVYDPGRNFQRTTFSAIKALGIVLRRLEVRAKPGKQ